MSCVTQGLTREAREIHTVARSRARAFEGRTRSCEETHPDYDQSEREISCNLDFS